MAKTIFLKVRVTAEDRDRYTAALASEGKTLSDAVRAFLERKARRLEREQKQ